MPTRSQRRAALNQQHAGGQQYGVSAQISQTTFQGPLPHPEILEQYDRICPGFAERSLTMVEEQAAHRRSLEGEVARSKIKHERIGQNMAFILALVLLLIGGGAVYTHETVIGTSILGVDFTAIIGMFIYREVREERRSKQGLPPQNIS